MRSGKFPGEEYSPYVIPKDETEVDFFILFIVVVVIMIDAAGASPRFFFRPCTRLTRRKRPLEAIFKPMSTPATVRL